MRCNHPNPSPLKRPVWCLSACHHSDSESSRLPLAPDDPNKDLRRFAHFLHTSSLEMALLDQSPGPTCVCVLAAYTSRCRRSFGQHAFPRLSDNAWAHTLPHITSFPTCPSSLHPCQAPPPMATRCRVPPPPSCTNVWCSCEGLPGDACLGTTPMLYPCCASTCL